MDHNEFVSRTKLALEERSSGSADEAVTKLRLLLGDLDLAVKSAVNDWHQQQALGLLIDALDAAGRKAECEAVWKQLIQFNKDRLKYWEIALTTATEQFESWKS